MGTKKASNMHYAAIAWGAGLIWIGILGLIPGNQNVIGMLGIGFILLGLNMARSLSRIPMSWFTTGLGILALSLGLAALLLPRLNFAHIELDLFSLLLIVSGLYFLIPSPKGLKVV